jgi:hypothetical protein
LPEQPSAGLGDNRAVLILGMGFRQEQTAVLPKDPAEN